MALARHDMELVQVLKQDHSYRHYTIAPTWEDVVVQVSLLVRCVMQGQIAYTDGLPRANEKEEPDRFEDAVSIERHLVMVTEPQKRKAPDSKF